jgi:hypothetical protein
LGDCKGVFGHGVADTQHIRTDAERGKALKKLPVAGLADRFGAVDE